jgi:hypothetical protein
MTLPAAPPISLDGMKTEFGLATPVVFPTDLYGKGGAPAAGALSFADMLGRSAATPPAVAMADGSVDGSNQGGFRIKTTGQWQTVTDNINNGLLAWLTAGSVADVEVMVTRTGTGTYTGPTLGAWLALTGDLVFSLSATATARNSTFTVTFRNKNTLAQLDTATVTVNLAGGGGGGSTMTL